MFALFCDIASKRIHVLTFIPKDISKLLLSRTRSPLGTLTQAVSWGQRQHDRYVVVVVRVLLCVCRMCTIFLVFNLASSENLSLTLPAQQACL